MSDAADPTGRRLALTPIADSVVLAWGWRRALIAFVAGGVSALAMAPFNAWPLLFVTFPVVVWLIDGAASGRLGGVLSAAGAGWWFGFGYFLAGLYWVGYAFLVDAKTFGWLLPFAVLALPAGLACFTAFGLALARAFWRPGASRVLVLAMALTASEWLRGHVLSGFPWNALGYALTGPLILAQTASLVGLWGLTLIAVAVFASPATLADEANETPRRWLAPAISLGVLAVMAMFGGWRLATNDTSFVPKVHLRIMQPNLQQDEKFNYSAKNDIVARYISLSDRSAGPDASGVKDVTHLIWPESAFPFFLVREPAALAQIAAMLPPGTVLITGAARPSEPLPGTQELHAYNSIYVIDHDGSILGVYDKEHLVPFGEYLPFQSFLESLGLMQLTKVQGGFLAGTRRPTMTVPRAPPFLPLICYEIIFPGAAVQGDTRPGWMLNVTNDAWFGVSPGPYQHFQQARVRAIEEGLPLVRAANTGISAVVDPLGRVVKSLPLGTQGVLDSGLPQAVAPPLYARFGDNVMVAMFAGMIVTVVLAGRRTSRRRSSRIS